MILESELKAIVDRQRDLEERKPLGENNSVLSGLVCRTRAVFGQGLIIAFVKQKSV